MSLIHLLGLEDEIFEMIKKRRDRRAENRMASFQ